ncbi:VOC family protein [Methylobacterium sp. E-066]|uniref:VOC family protein n=1 Tax=Methylobacterium sp. E-066 TaxID=2836584 RepID=UPI001FBB33E2|nr:VOC family protein [Methylobacterium sp. E-066]MCJ2144617.1 VOC family protein [Methylobacterium sp. E-066]
MASEHTRMDGEISYFEVGSGDAAVTARFLTDLFGWSFTTMGDTGDGWFQTPRIRAGLHGNDPAHGIVLYFSVTDIEAAAARVRALGGDVEGPSEAEAGFGRFCNCRDSQGLRFGLHQPG